MNFWLVTFETFNSKYVKPITSLYGYKRKLPFHGWDSEIVETLDLINLGRPDGLATVFSSLDKF